MPYRGQNWRINSKLAARKDLFQTGAGCPNSKEDWHLLELIRCCCSAYSGYCFIDRIGVGDALRLGTKTSAGRKMKELDE